MKSWDWVRNHARLVWVTILAVILVGLRVGFDELHPSQHALRLLISIYDRSIELIAIVAGLIALFFEHGLDRRFNEQKAKIDRIVDSVLTRSIGEWPDHLSEITALVKSTRRGQQLLVHVDFLGYAHFSRHDLFVEYLEELQNARQRGVGLKILLNSEKALEQSLADQFLKEKNDPAAAQELAQRYHEGVAKAMVAKPKLESYGDFVTAVLCVNGKYCDVLLNPSVAKAAEIASKADAPPKTVSYWLIQEGNNLRKMIFAYSRFSGVETGYGFQTEDSHLMKIFSLDFERQWKDAVQAKSGSQLVPAAWKEAASWPESAKSTVTGQS